MWRCLLLTLFLSHPIEAQRLKRGCVEAGGPLTCESRHVTNNLVDLNEAEEVCAKLVLEIIPEDITLDVTQHTNYLDSIKEDDPWCHKFRKYYGNCMFCHPDDLNSCGTAARYARCAGKMSLEDVMEIEKERFQSAEDINNTCTALEQVAVIWTEWFPWNIPTTVDFCERLVLIKHLCPGSCDGTCFDPVSHPPSCDKGSNPSSSNNSRDTNSSSSEHWFKTCTKIYNQAFLEADMGYMQLSIKNQTDYLRAIQDDTHLGQNNSFCLQAREAYSHCFWCSEQRCFGDHWPATCRIPPEFYNLSNDQNIDEDQLCEELYSAMETERAYDVDYTNVTNYEVLIPDNNDFCDLARLVFHRCWWCAPSVSKGWGLLNETVRIDFCLPESACGSPVALPSDFESNTLKSMGMTMAAPYLAQNNSQDSCDKIYEHYMANWVEPHSLLSCFDEIYLGRLCPVQFCGYKPAKTIDKNYLGATTTAQKRALIWLSRVSAMLSFVGALYIIVDCVKDAAKRKLVYHQLLVGMAVFDMVTAIAWAFATLPINKDEAGHVEGAKGNEATCMAQACKSGNKTMQYCIHNVHTLITSNMLYLTPFLQSLFSWG